MPFEAARLFVTVGAETREAENSLRSMGQKVDSFASSLKAGLLQGAGIEAFNLSLRALSDSFGALKAAAVDYNSLLEQTRIAFTTMLAPVVNGFKDMTEGAKLSFAMLQNLREFAQRTPFEFPELVRNTQRLLAFGFAADEVIPQLEAIGNVSAGFGKGEEGINRISRALGQMSAAGKVTQEDLNQLVDVGVPVFDILAEATGRPKTELRKLVEQGQISSDFFIKAFNDWSKANFGDMMALQARTFTGALSNISDVLRDTIASAAEPFFNRMRDGLVSLGDMLTSPQFKVWAQAGAAAMESLGQSFDGLMQNLAPVGDAIRAVFARLSEGDVAGAFAQIGHSILAGLQSAVDTVNAFGEGMFGAGWNLVTQLGSGMAGAFDDAINVVVEGLAALASMLVGQSPPPAGPLKDIDKGGEAAGRAWGDPFALQLKESATVGVGAVATAVDGLKAKSKEVAAQIRDIDSQNKELERTMRGVRQQIDDVKDGFSQQAKEIKEAAESAKQGYQDAISGVRDQMDAIRDATAAETETIQTQIEAVKDKYESALQSTRDEIDKVKASFDEQTRAAQDAIEATKDRYAEMLESTRSRIDELKDSFSDQTQGVQDQIDLLKDQYATTLDGIKEKIDRIKRSSESQLRPLELQIKSAREQNDVLREQADIQNRLKSAATAQLRLRAMGDPVLRAQLQGQMAGLDAQEELLSITEQIEDAQKKLKDPESDLTMTGRLRLETKIQQLQIEQKLAQMVDTTALADAARQESLQTAQQAQLKITREIEDANRRIVEIPIEKKIAQIKAEAEGALQPLSDQMADVERKQKAALDPLQDKLKAIKREEQDALRPLQSRVKQIERDQKAALEPLTDRLREIKREEQDALRPLQGRLKDLQAGQKAALEPLTDRLRDLKNEEKEALKPLEARLKGLQKESTEAARHFDDMQEALTKQAEAAIKPLEDQLKEYQKQRDALNEQKEALAEIKRGIDEAAQASKDAGKNAAPRFSLPPGAQRVARAPLDPNAAVRAEDIKKAGRDLADRLAEGFREQLESHMGAIIGGAIGGAIGGIAFGPIGAVVGAGLGAAIGEKLQARLAELGITPEMLLESLSNLVTKLRDDLAPAFELFLTNANELFQTLRDNKETIAGIVAGLTAFLVIGRISAMVVAFAAAWGPTVAILGEALSIGASVVAIFTETGSITIALGAAMTALSGPIAAVVALLGGPLTLVIAAIAIAIGVLTAAWLGNWGNIQGKTQAVGEAIGSAIQGAGRWLSWIGEQAASAGATIARAWDSLRSATTSAWDAIRTFITNWWGVLLSTVIGGPIGLVVALVARNWDAIKAKTTEIWEGIKAYLMTFWEAIPDDIRADLVLIYTTIVERLEKIVEAVKKQFDAVSTSIHEAIDAAQKYLAERWAAIEKNVSDTWESIVKTITPIVESIERLLSDTWKSISDTATRAWNEVLRFLDDTFGKGLRALKGWTSQFATDWGTWAAEMLSKAKETGDGIIKGLWEGIDSLRQWLVDSFWDLVRFFLGKVKEILGIASPSSVFFEYGKALIEGLMAGVRALWEGGTGFYEWATGLFGSFLGKIREILGIDQGDSTSSIFSHIGSAIISSFKAGVESIWNGSGRVLDWIGGFVTEFIGRWYTGFGMSNASDDQRGSFRDIGASIINALKNGMESMVHGMLDWLRREVIDQIPESIRKALGINSPSSVMFDIGVNTMHGLINGLKSRIGDLHGVQGLITKLMSDMGWSGGGAAPEQIRAWLARALQITGKPASWLPALEIVAMNESGGDPTAVNPKAVIDDQGRNYGHATGLMQTIPPTFEAYKQGGMDNILDPVHNAVAAINYIARRYGDAYNVPGVRSILAGGQYRPYRSGGVIDEDVAGVGATSGRGYLFHRDEGIFNSEQMARLAPVSALAGSAIRGGPMSITNVMMLGNVYGYRDFATHLVKTEDLNRTRGRTVRLSDNSATWSN